MEFLLGYFAVGLTIAIYAFYTESKENAKVALGVLGGIIIVASLYPFIMLENLFYKRKRKLRSKNEYT